MRDIMDTARRLRIARAALLEDAEDLMRENSELFVSLSHDALLAPDVAADHLRALSFRVNEGDIRKAPHDLDRLLRTASTASVFAFTANELLSIITSFDAFCEVLRVLANPTGELQPRIVAWTDAVRTSRWVPQSARLGNNRYEARPTPDGGFELHGLGWSDLTVAREMDYEAPGSVCLELTGNGCSVALLMAAFRQDRMAAGESLALSINGVTLRATQRGEGARFALAVEKREEVTSPTALFADVRTDVVQERKFVFVVKPGSFSELTIAVPQTLGVVDRRFELRLADIPRQFGLEEFYSAFVLTVDISGGAKVRAWLDRREGRRPTTDLGIKLIVRLLSHAGQVIVRSAAFRPGSSDGSMPIAAHGLTDPASFAGQIEVRSEAVDEEEF
jgi:hypothetical protein